MYELTLSVFRILYVLISIYRILLRISLRCASNNMTGVHRGPFPDTSGDINILFIHEDPWQ